MALPISKSGLILISMATAIIIRIFLIRELEAAIVVTGGTLLLILFIRNAQWFADNILSLGFMSYFAKDFKTSSGSGPALEFLGWLAMIGMLVLVYTLP